MSVLASMTGFARDSGTLPDGGSFVWELRSVNGRGLDLRLRLPAGLDALEPALREAVQKRLKRGNVSATLTVKREERTAPRLTPDPAALDQALKAAQVEVAAFYGPPSPTNFGGALLTGSQSDCKAACDAFAAAVMDVANHPIVIRR